MVFQGEPSDNCMLQFVANGLNWVMIDDCMWFYYQIKKHTTNNGYTDILYIKQDYLSIIAQP